MQVSKETETISNTSFGNKPHETGWWQPFNSSILLALNFTIMTGLVALRVSKQSNVTYQYLESAVMLVLTNNLLQVPTEFKSP
jgi:hypothetical protein